MKIRPAWQSVRLALNIDGSRTIRRRTIRRGQFGAINSAHHNSARTIRRDNSSRTIQRKVYIIHFIENSLSNILFINAASISANHIVYIELGLLVEYITLYTVIGLHYNQIIKSIIDEK